MRVLARYRVVCTRYQVQLFGQGYHSYRLRTHDSFEHFSTSSLRWFQSRRTQKWLCCGHMCSSFWFNPPATTVVTLLVRPPKGMTGTSGRYLVHYSHGQGRYGSLSFRRRWKQAGLHSSEPPENCGRLFSPQVSSATCTVVQLAVVRH